MENGYPVFHLPFSKKTECVTLERVLVECFKKLYALSALSLHSKPSLTVVSIPPDLSASSQAFLLSCLRRASSPLSLSFSHSQSSPVPLCSPPISRFSSLASSSPPWMVRFKSR